MQQLGKYFKGDRTIWMIVLLLAIFSLLIVYSSTAAITGRASTGPFYYFTKQLMFFVAGFVLLYIIYLTPYQLFMAFAKIGFILSIALLVITLILGSSYNQAVRTLFFFQPAEIAKIMLITYVAKQITVKQDKIKSFKEGFLPILIPVLVTCFLVFISNFSTAAIMGTTCFIMMYIGRVRLRHLLGTIGVLLLALIIGMSVSKGISEIAKYKRGTGQKVEGLLAASEKLVNKTRFVTMYSRIFDRVSKSESNNEGLDQADYSKLAIASGGLIIGKGPGNSTLRYILPEAFSDFVFAIIAEEYGVLIASLFVLAYLIVLYRIGIMVKKSTHFFPALLAIGIGTQIVMQALVNMCVATGIAPVTGQNLPLISQGGSSIISTCIMFGMILSISRSISNKEIEDRIREMEEEENAKEAQQVSSNNVIA